MYRTLICLMLLPPLCLSGCAGKAPENPKPEPFGQDDKEVWLRYYEQSFKQYGSAVLPPKDAEPNAAREAYMQARAAWKSEQRRKQVETIGAVGAMFVLAVIIWLK